MGHLNKQYAALRSKNATADWVEIYSEGAILCLYLWHFTRYFFILLYYLGIFPNEFFIEISSKCSGMEIRTLLHKWFQPIVCTARCDHFFLAISGTEYWKAINLCQHLLILITWQVFGNLNLLETNVTVFYFQSVSKEINSAC